MRWYTEKYLNYPIFGRLYLNYPKRNLWPMKLVSGVSIVFAQADVNLTVKLENSDWLGLIGPVDVLQSPISRSFFPSFLDFFFSLLPPLLCRHPYSFAFRTHIHKWADRTTFLPTLTLLLHVHMGQAVSPKETRCRNWPAPRVPPSSAWLTILSSLTHSQCDVSTVPVSYHVIKY